MPRVLQLLVTLFIAGVAFVQGQLWANLVLFGGLGSNSGVSWFFPVILWPAAIVCITFYLIYVIWRT